MTLMDKIMAINSTVNGIVWGIPMLILIVGTGIYMTVKLNFFQFRHFGYAMKNTIGKVLDKSQKVEAQKGAITPMQAVTTALAATVGTGNIVGVTGAIALGGPGAVFWMEISALLGMATKFSEVTLATKYREKNDKRRLGRRPHVLHQERPWQEVGMAGRRVRCAGRHLRLRHRQHLPDELHRFLCHFRCYHHCSRYRR